MRYFFSIIFSLSVLVGVSQSGLEIVKQSIESSKAITSGSFEIEKSERVNGKLKQQRSAIKYQKVPYKMYARQIHPKEGLEVLFAEGTNDDEAIINTNGFPWVNLNLDPFGSIMRKDQHHTVYQAGYDYFMSILNHLIIKYDDDVDQMITNEGVVDWQGNSCWKITLKDNHFRYIKYWLSEGETVQDVADKLFLSPYMILQMNDNVDFYKDGKEGLELTIPNDYAPEMVMFIDQRRMIPLKMQVYIENELYEQYEYYNVLLNPHFPEGTFDKTNPEYGF